MRSPRTTTLRTLAASAVLAAACTGLTTTAAHAAATCQGGVQSHPELTTTWTGLSGATLVKGGAAVESTAVFRNTTGHDVKDFQTSFYVAADDAPTEHMADALTVELKLPGGDWKPASFGTGDGQSIISTGTYQLAKGDSVTVGIRVTATTHALAGKYGSTETGGSAALSDDTGEYLLPTAPVTGTPGPTASPATTTSPSPTATSTGKDTCTQFVGYSTALFTITDPAAPTSAAASPSASATTHRPTATPTTTATTSAGPSLAFTGGGSGTGTIAAIGATTLTAGAGVLFLLRRRKPSHR
ncbi:hypothetical protein ACFYNO_29910 [Kitasatospora sp. NPDC006697]|uniref:hypothetical protein n=1 Tax=Kitasatospora sp. NPDC006697 TaxID=3364020 RepID=UPI0036CCDA8A